jgi:alkylated DNA repair dioxygenase AlkB
MTADLFGEALLPGLEYRPEFIEAAEERSLLDQLHAIDLSPFRFHGWTGKRKTHTFGWRYDFDDASFAPAEPLPEWLHPLRAKAATLAGLEPEEFVHALLARYDPGAGIGWHRDRPVFDKVVGVSLGAQAVLRFRQRTDSGFNRVQLAVEPRSAYLLSGDARHEWEHSIAPGGELRFSITFRTLSQLGRRKAAAF